MFAPFVQVFNSAKKIQHLKGLNKMNELHEQQDQVLTYIVHVCNGLDEIIPLCWDMAL